MVCVKRRLIEPFDKIPPNGILENFPRHLSIYLSPGMGTASPPSIFSSSASSSPTSGASSRSTTPNRVPTGSRNSSPFRYSSSAYSSKNNISSNSNNKNITNNNKNKMTLDGGNGDGGYRNGYNRYNYSDSRVNEADDDDDEANETNHYDESRRHQLEYRRTPNCDNETVSDAGEALDFWGRPREGREKQNNFETRHEQLERRRYQERLNSQQRSSPSPPSSSSSSSSSPHGKEDRFSPDGFGLSYRFELGTSKPSSNNIRTKQSSRPFAFCAPPSAAQISNQITHQQKEDYLFFQRTSSPFSRDLQQQQQQQQRRRRHQQQEYNPQVLPHSSIVEKEREYLQTVERNLELYKMEFSREREHRARVQLMLEVSIYIYIYMCVCVCVFTAMIFYWGP